MKYQIEEKDLIKNKKFKHISILLSFVMERDYTKNGYLQLLCDILSDSCQKYNSKKVMSYKMYELYNTNLYIYGINNFNTTSFNVNLEFINPKYLKDDNFIDSVFDFFKEVVFNPLLNDEKNGFNQKVFNECKDVLITNQKNIYNKKSTYAYIKFINKMKRDDEKTIIDSLDENLYKRITNEDLYAFYQDIFKKSKIFVKASGDIEFKELSKRINALNLATNEIKIDLFDISNRDVIDVKHFEEKQEIFQSHLYMGYRTNISFNDPQYVSYLTFLIMFGGMFNSSLTTNIRERQSLVYHISASILPEEKIFYVYSANDNNKCEYIIEKVQEELNRYINENIENGEELLKLAKETIINDMNSTYDSASGIVSQALKYELRGFRDDKEFFKLLEEVKIEDIIFASKSLKLDTIFILRGK